VSAARRARLGRVEVGEVVVGGRNGLAALRLVAHRREVTDAVQKARGMVVAHLFHRNGECIRHFHRSWASACVAAGLGHEVRKPDVLDGLARS